MAAIERDDLISQGALKAPYELAEGIDKLIAILEKLRGTSRESGEALKTATTSGKIVAEINKVQQAQSELAKVQEKVVLNSKTLWLSQNEVAESQAKAAKQAKATGTVITELDKETQKAVNSSIAWAKAQGEASKEAKKAADTYRAESGSLEELIQKKQALSERLKQLKTDQAEDIELKKQGILTEAEFKQRLVENGAEMAKVNARVLENNAAIRDHVKEQSIDSKTVNAASNSLKQLEIALAKNRREYSNLTGEQQRNSKQGQELLKVIQEQDKQSKELSKSIGLNQKEVGSYREAIASVIPSFHLLETGAGKASKAFTVLSRHPLVLVLLAIVAALSSVATYFKSTEEGAKKLKLIFAGINGVLVVLKDYVIEFGKSIFEAFSNPKQAAIDLWEAIKTNIVNRFYGIIELFTAVKDVGVSAFTLIKESIKDIFGQGDQAKIDEAKEKLVQAGKDGLNAFVKINTGIDDAIGKLGELGEATKKVFNEISDSVDKSIAIQKRENKLRVDQRKFLVEEAKLQREINKNREISADRTLVEEERLDALLKSQEANEKLEQKRLSLAKQEFSVYKDRVNLSRTDPSIDDKQKLAELEAEIINIESQASQSRVMMTRQISMLRNQINDRDHKLALQRIKDQTEAMKQAAAERVEIERRELDNRGQELREQLQAGLISRRQYDNSMRDLQRIASERLIQAQVDEIAKLLTINEDYHKQRIEEAKNSGLKQAEIEIEIAKVHAETTEEKIALEKKLHDLKIALGKVEQDNLENKYENEIAFLEDLMETFTKWAETVGALFNSITERRTAAIDAEIKKNEEFYDKQIELAGDNERAKQHLEAESARKREQLEKKKIAEQRKAAAYEKAVALTQAAISTALAVIRALSAPPGVPFTIPMGVLAGALGAIQIAAIAAKPLPQYFKGTDNHPGGLAVVGEKGAELGITKSGEHFLTPSVASIMDVPKGAKIIPHEETMMHLAKQSLQSMKIDSISVDFALHRRVESLEGAINRQTEILADALIEGRVDYAKQGSLLMEVQNKRNGSKKITHSRAFGY